MSQTATKNAITLKGSAAIISEYLKYGINSILFQRGIYPGESFTNEQNYGLTILMSTDPKIKDYLNQVLSQLEDWLRNDQVEQISMIIKDVAHDEIVECWDFKVTPEKVLEEAKDVKKVTSDKDLKKIQAEIRDVMRQIAATVSYLPLLDCTCSFDVLIHTKELIDMPSEWSEAKAAEIKDKQVVSLKSFSTGLQKMDTVVSYKMMD
ncbi:mitotic spindle assembly checkpoint protein MAD2A [Culicoides brevitarsis]|uniref:mitotic spindle assembly checkpoint protein MAD2A n=1 Tax=Culicoides brevitarsis TaxID=469753 RepID=UPI00307C86BE